jgi:hypothetical protein
VIGERRNAKLVYLAITSRLLSSPVSLVVKGVSSGGKSHTVEAVVRLFPRHAVIVKTGMSERALIYMREEFAHRTLVIYEATALREQREKTEGDQTAYFIRSLLSEGRLNYEVTVRDKEGGGWTTKTIVKEGPTNLVLTTTATSLHSENETRMFSLPVNDTPEQTRRVLIGLARERAERADLTEWHELQECLTDDGERRVTIPYADALARAVPPVAVRLRRDFKAILSLIRAHAILHQQTRERDAEGRIIATLADYAAVRALVLDLVAEGVGATVPATIRETVAIVASMGDPATVKEVADLLKVGRSAAQYRLMTARQHGYVVNVEEKRGRPARYSVGDAMPDEQVLLPTLEELEGV